MQGHQIASLKRHAVRAFKRVVMVAPRKQVGFTLVEAMMVVCILAILLGTAVPSFLGFQERYRLEGLALELVADIHFLRSEAVARNMGLRLSFSTDAGGTCYLLHTGNAGDCRCSSDGTAQCNNSSSSMIKSVGLTTTSGIRIQANVLSMLFDPGRGTTTPAGSVNFIGNSGKAIRHVVNIAGRARTCSPEASVSGYKIC